MINIAFGQSKYCIDNLSENINRGHQAKLRKGIWSNFAPLEYSNEFYATGEYILKALAKVLDHAGLRSYKSNVLSISYVQRLLQNSIYYGVFSFNDEIYNRTHELIISKKLFGSIQ